jgi:hypothetical protein
MFRLLSSLALILIFNSVAAAQTRILNEIHVRFPIPPQGYRIPLPHADLTGLNCQGGIASFGGMGSVGLLNGVLFIGPQQALSSNPSRVVIQVTCTRHSPEGPVPALLYRTIITIRDYSQPNTPPEPRGKFRFRSKDRPVGGVRG